VLGSTDSCQRTLEVTPASSSAAAGSALTVTVRGYDDNGRGVNVADAAVTLGSATATTAADGTATLTVRRRPAGSGSTATHAGMVAGVPARGRGVVKRLAVVCLLAVLAGGCGLARATRSPAMSTSA
jgi:hypothetical protein